MRYIIATVSGGGPHVSTLQWPSALVYRAETHNYRVCGHISGSIGGSASCLPGTARGSRHGHMSPLTIWGSGRNREILATSVGTRGGSDSRFREPTCILGFSSLWPVRSCCRRHSSASAARRAAAASASSTLADFAASASSLSSRSCEGVEEEDHTRTSEFESRNPAGNFVPPRPHPHGWGPIFGRWDLHQAK